MIGQAAVAVAAVLDQSPWALGSVDIVDRLAGLEDIATSVRVAQARLVHELAGRDWPRMHGSTSTANFLRDFLRISGSAADRLVKLGAMLDRREAMGAAMSAGSQAVALAGPLGDLVSEAAAADVAPGSAETAPAEADSGGATTATEAHAGEAMTTAETGAGSGEATTATGADSGAAATAGEAGSGAAATAPDSDSAAAGSDADGLGDDRDDGDAASVAKPVVGIAVNPEQAIVIGAIMKNLPHDLDPKLVDTCEAELIKLAAVYEPTLLRHQGEKILDYIAPEIADEALEAKLNREEAAARRKRAFSIRDNGNGSHSIWGHLDTESATILKSAIDPLAKPIPAGTDAERDQRLPEQRRADALIDVCRLALQADTLPDNGGQRPQLNVTVKYDILTKELSAGTLDIGGQLSPTTVRRLACDALILPAVLGNRGEVLDLGRQRRLYTGAVRRAIILRDGGCAFPGCDRPPTWCQVHHWKPWHTGGTTCAADGLLLCSHHHHTVHLPGGWEIIRDTDGQFSFKPPRYVDPDQRPQRNRYHTKT